MKLRWLLKLPRIFRVEGGSMLPTFQPGDWLWVDASCDSLPEPGDVVVLRDPRKPSRILVKRVRSRGDDTFSVGSDNPAEGTDSRHFGSLEREFLVGRVKYSWPVHSSARSSSFYPG